MSIRDDQLDAIQEMVSLHQKYGEGVGMQSAAVLLEKQSIDLFLSGDHEKAIFVKDMVTLLRRESTKLFDEWRDTKKRRDEIWAALDKQKEHNETTRSR